MKYYNIFIFLLVFATTIQGQEPVSALFLGNNTPDSIVQITMILPGTTTAQTLTVEVTDGWAYTEGDIVLGRIEELQHMAEDRGIAIDGNQFRWPAGNIPYVINAGFTPQYVNMLRQAIDYVTGATHLNVRPQSLGDNRWIEFNPSSVCNSAVGMHASNTINLKDPFAAGNGSVGCYFPQIIHEIAHAAGLWHEQSREDRNNWVTINWGNIQPGMEHNFHQHISDGIDLGPYDFISDMHYGPMAFSQNNQPTITANGGQIFGNAVEYSAGDVAAINWMYPVNACQSSFISGADFPQIARPLHFESFSLVYSKNNIPAGNQVIFDAAQSITLAVGFQATIGSTFRAVIDGCGGAVQSIASPEELAWQLEAENHKHGLSSPESSSPDAGNGKIAPAAGMLTVFPNPFTDRITIRVQLAEAGPASLTLSDFSGRVVQTMDCEELAESGQFERELQVAGLSPGIYMLQLQYAGGQQTVKLVKIGEK